VSSADLKCPVCSKALEASEHGVAAKQLEKLVLQRFRDQMKKDKKENAAAIAKLKQVHHRQLQVLEKRHKGEKKSLQKRMDEQAKRSKESQKREIAELRRNYQAQLEHVRDFYGTQNAALQSELKASFAAQLESMKKNYEGLALGNQRQLEMLQKYVEEQMVGELREKVSALEEEKMAAELRLSEIVQQLDQSNAEVVSLKERLNHAGVMPQEHAQAQIHADSPEQGDARDEILKIVKEVAEQREKEVFKELDDNFEGEEEEKHGFWGNKSSKKFGLF
jgi:DNA repair exonuclease SbcCD ATPase subunit